MSVTLIIVIATVGISLYAWNNSGFMQKLIFNPYTVKRSNEYYRFLTSGFLHGGYMHLFFNMFVLYIFGRRIEMEFLRVYGEAGSYIFCIFYLLGITVSSIPSFIKYKDLPHYNALGASGGVSSVLFSFVLFEPVDKIYLYGIIGLPGIVWAALYAIYSYYMSKQNRDNIGHEAHLFGGIFGIIFTILAIPGIIPDFFSKLPGLNIF